MTKNKGLWFLAILLSMTLSGGSLLAQETETVTTDGGWLSLIDTTQAPQGGPSPITGGHKPVGMKPSSISKPLWLPTVSLDYTAASDYVFRGINRSEYPGEGREALNHQLGLNIEWDLCQFGRAGGNIWWNWYADQNSRRSGFNTNQYGDTDDSHLQEVDYSIYYGYTIEQIGLDVEVGFSWYTFPSVRHLAMGPSATQVVSGDAATTQEIYLMLRMDDSPLWRALGFNTTKPVLNPYFFIAWDIDLGHCGSYSELGMSHTFAFSDWTQCPVIKDMSLTPGMSLAYSRGWLEYFSLDRSAGNGNMNGFMNVNYSLNLTWMASDTLNIPDEFGSLAVSAFLDFSDAIAHHWLDDEFYGGMSVGWKW